LDTSSANFRAQLTPTSVVTGRRSTSAGITISNPCLHNGSQCFYFSLLWRRRLTSYCAKVLDDERQDPLG
jgi:hypothetical protein